MKRQLLIVDKALRSGCCFPGIGAIGCFDIPFLVVIDGYRHLVGSRVESIGPGHRPRLVIFAQGECDRVAPKSVEGESLIRDGPPILFALTLRTALLQQWLAKCNLVLIADRWAVF